MLRLQTILVPVDFSERSTAAVEHAMVMAKRFDSKVILLHVIPPLPYSTLGFGAGHVAGVDFLSHPEMEAAARDKMADLTRKVSGDRPIETQIAKGDPAACIEEAVRQRQTGLVMIPTHGYGPFRRFIVGSVTAKVLHDVSCPVFTGAHVPEIAPTRTDPYEHVACAIDLGEHSETVLRWAWDFTQAWEAKLSVIHAARSFEQDWTEEMLIHSTREKIVQLMDRVQCAGEILLEGADVVPYVPQTAERIGADILIIGRSPDKESQGRLRTHAYSLVRESPCPVISV